MKFGGAPKCPRCGKSVYAAEQVKALGQSWHKTCFACGECKKSLHSGDACDNGGQPYCKACYGKKFGPKGIGFGVMADTGVVPASTPAPQNASSPAATCLCGWVDPLESRKQPKKSTVPARRPSMEGLTPAQRAVELNRERARAAERAMAEGELDGAVDQEEFANLGAKTTPIASKSSVGKARFKYKSGVHALGGGAGCPRCGKSVGFAEKISFIGKSWHKDCFTCTQCSRGLNTGNACDSNGQPFCKPCHSKLFGPKGYGYGTGAGVLTDTGVGAAVRTSATPVTSPAPPPNPAPKRKNSVEELRSKFEATSTSQSKPVQKASKVALRFGGAPKCPRCGKSVYAAEQVKALGQSWHKTCFACGTCEKSLHSGDACDNGGQPYCKACYAKKCGPKGIGFGVMADTGISREKL